MDTTDPEISFDKQGICNHCKDYYFIENKYQLNDRLNQKLNIYIDKIKKSRLNNEYDCVIGVSGGIDSSYVLYLAVKMGLNPIAFHIDNKWDTSETIQNIKNLTRKLDVPLKNYVVNWEEFKDLQLSFLKSSTKGVEVPTDHAVLVYPYIAANEFNSKYIISGYNYRTESHLPRTWSPGQNDWIYIQSIHKKFGNIELNNYSHFTPYQVIWRQCFLSTPFQIALLNYVDYIQKEAMDTLNREVGFNYYGGKHHESLYTRFLQAYILPKKFNIDKRRSHFSSLICSNQMTREKALKKLSEPPCDKKTLEQDKKIFKNMLGLDDNEFDLIMNSPPKTYWDYPHSKLLDRKMIPSAIPNYLSYLRAIIRGV